MRLTMAVAQVAKVLVERPEDETWLQDVCRRVQMHSGVVHPILQRMADAGWLADRREAGDATRQGPPRRFFAVTTSGLRELRALLDRARTDPRFRPLFDAEPPAPPADAASALPAPPVFQQPGRR